MNRALLLLATALAWLVPATQAQEMKASSKLYARLEGDVLKVAIEVKVEPSWHLYHGPLDTDIGSEGAVGKPTTVEFDAQGFELEPLHYPEPRKVPQTIGEQRYLAYEHVGTFVLQAWGRRTKPDAKLADLSATISGLTCVDSGVCIPYDEELELAGAGPDALFASMPPRAGGASSAATPSAGAVESVPMAGLGSASGAAQASPFEKDRHAAARLFAREKDGTIQIAVEIQVEPKWHLYHGPETKDIGDEDAGGLPTTVEFAPSGFEIGALRYPEPERVPVTMGTNEYTSLEHKGTFVLRGTAKRTKADAKLEDLKATVRGLTCEDGGTCVQYEQEIVCAGAGSDALHAAEIAPPQAKSNVPPPSGGQSDGDLWLFLLSAVGWGLFTLLMPCTYPMIPITISYFTKQAAQRKGSTLPLSLAYGVGIIGTFVLIGLIVGPPIIVFASHPITNLVIGLMFVFFALTLFGAINLQPPAFLLNVAGQASSKGGIAGVFLMGATLVVTSFTCTAPFVGTLLSTGASSGGLGRVALGMAVFGATMAVPFVGLSMLPGKVKAIPKSGEWMHTLKVTLGFVEIAAALKFISNADLVWKWEWLSRELYLVLWVGIFAVTALYLFGMIKLKDEATTEVSPGRMSAGLLFVLLSAYCAYGAVGNDMDRVMTAIIPPYSKPHRQDARPILIDDYEGALARAKAEGKLLMANFTGYTCVNCRQMEESVFKQPAVERELGKMIEVRLHYDGKRGKEITAFQRKLLNSIAAPDYIIVDPRTGTILRRQDGPTDEKTFLEFLRGTY